MAKKKSSRKTNDGGDPQSGSPAGSAGKPGFPIVGLGASAGGLQALQRFFQALPEDGHGEGMAFVVVMHLHPEYESSLAQILQQYTKLTVQQVNARLEVEIGNVYVIPPNKKLFLTDSHLDLEEFESTRERQRSIDVFFRSLAHVSTRAVGIVLSGGGSDGTVGMKAVKENGGLLMAQHPDDAEHEHMPRSAIGTGLVDFILSAEELAQQVVAYGLNHSRIRLPEDREQLPDGDAEALPKIMAQLRTRTGHDFSNYKSSTLLRRIGRRMQMNQQETLTDYLQFLRTHAEEAQVLMKSLLISVTHFFRDCSAWEALAERVIPRLFQGKTADDQLRIWVPGCATGEEAYSLAMLLLEQSARQESPPEFQIFASDLDEQGLGFGRPGIYPEAISADVSDERLRRFFTREGNQYQINREIRERVLFAAHSLLKDPPFSRLHLISCRNLLIYLNRDLQDNLFQLFHYSLLPEAYLFLGSAESTESKQDLFRVVDKKHRIYQRIGSDKPARLPPLEASTALIRPSAPARLPREATQVSLTEPERHQKLLEQRTPPSLVVNRDYELLHLSHSAGRYLQRQGGRPTNQILREIRPELASDLQTALYQAFEYRRCVSTRPVQVAFNGEGVWVHLIVYPGREEDATQHEVVVILAEVDAPFLAGGQLEGDAPPGSQPEESQRLREQLQAALGEYETSKEEMKAANEELQSINEEYRSTAEELETSKEELQSLNEELETLNHELKLKVDELSQSNSDLQNLMASTEIGTLFLDRELRIKRFTPRITELFNVLHSDLNRPITDLTTRIDYAGLVDDAARVLRDLVTVERELPLANARWFLMRMRPYRTVDDRIEGVVVTFVEITERKQAEQALQESERQLAAELAAMQRLHILTGRLMVSLEPEAALNEVLEASMEITGAVMGDVQLYDPRSQSLTIVAHRGLNQELLDHFRSVVAGGDSASGRALQQRERVTIEDVQADPRSASYQHISNSVGFRSMQSTPLLNPQGQPLGMLSTYYARPHALTERELRVLDLYSRQAADFLARQHAEESLRLSEESFRTAAEALKGVIYKYNLQTGYVERSDSLQLVLGWQPDEVPPTFAWWWEQMHPEDQARLGPQLADGIPQGGPEFVQEYRLRHRDGHWVDVWDQAVIIRGEDDQPVRMIGCTVDISQRKTLEANLRSVADELEQASQRKDEFLALLAHELRTPLAPIRTGLEVLEMHQDDPEQVARVRSTMERQVLQLMTLVDDLLEVSRITQGKLDLRRELVPLNDVVQSAVEASQPLVDEGEHELSVKLPSPPLQLDADPHRLTQVISNLLNNAAKYTPNGGRIELEAERQGQEVVITVRDNGIGIPPEKQSEIFGMFNQISPRHEKGRMGLGIGLTLVKSLVEMHGGSTEVFSDGDGHGSTFTIRLPVGNLPKSSRKKESPDAPAPEIKSHCRVLIADDNPAASNLLSMVVQNLGLEVRTAGNGREAVELAASFRPHLILMDLGMPIMNGLEAAQEIRSHDWGRKITLVALSGWGQAEDKQRSREAGFDEHFVKPIGAVALKQLIARVPC